ncbi:HBL/NHE enterotoxin family protein [Actinoplanes sp. N902-109]|uniref:HBL/NHE enterotoxin family protein n=1 Tax=Actinoplanes sp. (strain N902-109) TaxID=649831 RepID=UPI0003294280|nr:HBL/NHE enterotoxin family protein [Actinoplanes sp. N902-109]AGL16222.1 hypothetical protein L083_2712 [Actinoplanes sp. N902-109]
MIAVAPLQRLEPAVREGFAAYLRMSGDATAIVNQQNLSLALVPTLAEDQALARAHAADCVVTRAPQMLVALTAVAGYADTVQAFTPALSREADVVDAGGDPRRLLVLLGALRRQLSVEISDLAATADSFGVFNQSAADDVTRFRQLSRGVPAAYGLELARLQERLDTLRQRLEDDNKTITGAAAALLPGLAALGLAAGAVVLSAGTAMVSMANAKVVIQKGYEMTKGVVDEVDKAMADSTAAIAEYRQVLTEATDDQLQLAAFTTVAGNVTRLDGTTAQTVAALNRMSTGWQDEDSYLCWLAALGQDPHPAEVRAATDVFTTRWETLSSDTAALLAAAVPFTVDTDG